jgi:hypothetical protein
LTEVNGLPLVVKTIPANLHDSRMALDLVVSMHPIPGPRGRPRIKPKVLQSDAVYGCATLAAVVKALGIRPLLKPLISNVLLVINNQDAFLHATCLRPDSFQWATAILPKLNIFPWSGKGVFSCWAVTCNSSSFGNWIAPPAGSMQNGLYGNSKVPCGGDCFRQPILTMLCGRFPIGRPTEPLHGHLETAKIEMAQKNRERRSRMAI